MNIGYDSIDLGLPPCVWCLSFSDTVYVQTDPV